MPILHLSVEWVADDRFLHEFTPKPAAEVLAITITTKQQTTRFLLLCS
jgi:hypothetical protein